MGTGGKFLKTHIIKLYNFKSLLRLVALDIQRSYGPKAVQGNIHFISGLDGKGEIYVRIDMNPLRLPDDKSKAGW